MCVGSWMVPSYDPELNLVIRGDFRHLTDPQVHARRRR